MGLLSESWKLDVITLLAVIFALCYILLRHTYTYWERNGFKAIPGASYICGHFGPTILQKESVGDFVTRLYKSTNEPFIGIYSILRPALLVRDPELLRSIFIKDFSHFTDHGIHCNEEYDPLSGHLFALPGQRWKNLRSKLTPAFSSSRLKGMFSTFVDSGSSLESHLENLANKGDLLDVREIAASHTTNVIASVGFGFEVDSIADPNNTFRVCGRKIFAATIYNGLRMFINFVAPKMMPFFRLRLLDPMVEKFLRTIVRENLEHREKNKVVRKDIFQLLVQVRNTGTVQLDNLWETAIEKDESRKSLSEDELAAQAFVFFAAGFETSSTTLAFCLYELAKHQEIQKRVHDEIDTVLAEYDGKITYESISAMKYLESCLDESLRKYPVLTVLTRVCVKDYKIPGTDKVIKEGTQILIPVMGLQNDEQYYENPERYDPNRFAEEGSAAKNSVNRPYLSFGDGPRNCIAQRMGKMQSKVGLVMMLRGYRFELNDTLKNRKMEFDPKGFLAAPLHKILLHTYKR